MYLCYCSFFFCRWFFFNNSYAWEVCLFEKCFCLISIITWIIVLAWQGKKEIWEVARERLDSEIQTWGSIKRLILKYRQIRRPCVNYSLWSFWRFFCKTRGPFTHHPRTFSRGLWTKDIWCLRLYVSWCDHPNGGRTYNSPNAGARISLIPSEGLGLFLQREY